MSDNIDKLIKYIQSKGCEHCPYCKYQDECHGIACYGGEPIEPPCCYITPHNYLDFDIILQEIEDRNNDNTMVKEVKRHAKIGEYIKIVDCDDVMGHEYENGDIFVVIKDDSVMDIVRGISEKYTCGDNGLIFYDYEYVVLEDYNPYETKQTKIVVDKINTEELVVPKTNIEIIKDVVSNLQNSLSFDFNLNMPCRGGKTATLLYFDELINEEREEKDMNKVLKLYMERKLKEIDDKYDKKVEDDYNAIEVVKQYNDLVNNFENKLEELFTSLDNFDNGYLVTQCDSNCYKYELSEGMIKNKIMDKYIEEKIADKLELDNLIGEVDAQLSLSDDLTYQLEVLSRYDIIDKKTNKMKV